jgi:hypothetical protein
VIEKIPAEDLPLTIIALKGFYKGSSQTEEEFIRIGYYVQNKALEDAGELSDPNTLQREICVDDPIVRQLPIKWD